MLVADLLRHGALEGGAKYRGLIDDPLTNEGRAAMDAVWARLATEVDLIVTSPLGRCVEPAKAWAQATGVECVIEPRIAEMHYGQWEGKTAEQIRSEYPGMLERWRADPTGMRPPGGESPEELRARLSQWWNEAQTQHDGRHILVVAHSGSLRMLISLVLEAPIATTRQLDMPYACWSRIASDHGHGWLEFHHQLP